MGTRSICLAVLACAFLSAGLAAKPQLGQQRLFKDWAAACDNTRSCEAVALLGDGQESDLLSLVVSSDRDGVRVSISGFETGSDRYRALVDGREVDSGAIQKANSEIKVGGADAEKLIRAIANGGSLELRDGANAVLGGASLAGSAAAFRYIDAVQARAGTGQALVALGKRAFRPRWLPAPIIKAARIKPDGPIPDANSIVDFVEKSPCAEERFGVTEDSGYSLGSQNGVARALVFVSCGSGAYNFSYAAYVGKLGDKGRWTFEPAKFDYEPNEAGLLVNVDWHADKQQLDNFSKGRGLGDCGNAESYVWDGAMFRLISALGMTECRGSIDWLPLWRADVLLSN